MTESPAAVPSERRKAVRVARSIDFRYSADSPAVTARLGDISELGAFVDSAFEVEVGSPVDFSLRLPYPQDPTPVRGRGRGAWVRPRAGFGLEFRELTEEDRLRIRLWVASVYFGPEGPASTLI